ncbi:MAG: hypothetical protein ACRCUH_13705 [Shewanella sp.]
MNCCVSGALVSSAAVNQEQANKGGALLLKQLVELISKFDLPAGDSAKIDEILEDLRDRLRDD